VLVIEIILEVGLWGWEGRENGYGRNSCAPSLWMKPGTSYNREVGQYIYYVWCIYASMVSV